MNIYARHNNVLGWTLLYRDVDDVVLANVKRGGLMAWDEMHFGDDTPDGLPVINDLDANSRVDEEFDREYWKFQ